MPRIRGPRKIERSSNDFKVKAVRPTFIEVAVVGAFIVLRHHCFV